MSVCFLTFLAQGFKLSSFLLLVSCFDKQKMLKPESALGVWAWREKRATINIKAIITWLDLEAPSSWWFSLQRPVCLAPVNTVLLITLHGIFHRLQSNKKNGKVCPRSCLCAALKNKLLCSSSSVQYFYGCQENFRYPTQVCTRHKSTYICKHV